MKNPSLDMDTDSSTFKDETVSEYEKRYTVGGILQEIRKADPTFKCSKAHAIKHELAIKLYSLVYSKNGDKKKNEPTEKPVHHMVLKKQERKKEELVEKARFASERLSKALSYWKEQERYPPPIPLNIKEIASLPCHQVDYRKFLRL